MYEIERVIISYMYLAYLKTFKNYFHFEIFHKEREKICLHSSELDEEIIYIQ